METIILRYCTIEFFFQCMMGVIGVVTLTACFFWLDFYRTWREKSKRLDANSRKKVHAAVATAKTSWNKDGEGDEPAAPGTGSTEQKPGGTTGGEVDA